MIYKNGDKYCGQWIEDRRKGKGELYQSLNQKHRLVYIGEWKNDRFEVLKLKLKDAKRYWDRGRGFFMTKMEVFMKEISKTVSSLNETKIQFHRETTWTREMDDDGKRTAAV